jgi:hypothetical protein
VVRVIDPDLATATGTADMVLLIEDDPPGLLHVELRSGWGGWLPPRPVAYNPVLAERHELPVATVVVPFAPRAEAMVLTGRYPVAPPCGPSWEFASVVRVRFGRKKLGPPAPDRENAVNAITDLDRLERLTEKPLDVSTRDELLTDT